MKQVLIGVVLGLVSGLTGCTLSSSGVPPTPSPAARIALTCQQIVAQALATTDEACRELGRNQACYGNSRVEVLLRDNASAVFATAGDVADLAALRRLTVLPFDEAGQTWGIALLKAQANLPDTLPGQNVTFLLYGDTAIDNPSPQMNAVTLRSAVGAPVCAEVPASAILIQSPPGAQVTLTLNGASVTLASTVHLTASQNDELTLATLEGSAVVSAFDTTRIVRPGAAVALPLGGADGLQVIGPPGDLRPFDLNAIHNAPLNLLERPVSLPPPIAAPETLTQAPLLTATLDAPFNPQRPVATQAACTVRGDWTGVYTVQAGDTLSTIARRFGVTPGELQRANCLPNADRILVGQLVRVPPPSPTPRPFFTATPVPPTAPPRPVVSFSADPLIVPIGQCALASWRVENAQQILFEGQLVNATGRQRVCPSVTTTYTLLVTAFDGAQIPYAITITTVLPFDTATPPLRGNPRMTTAPGAGG